MNRILNASTYGTGTRTRVSVLRHFLFLIFMAYFCSLRAGVPVNLSAVGKTEKRSDHPIHLTNASNCVKRLARLDSDFGQQTRQYSSREEATLFGFIESGRQES
jgi:hypothetical protein